MKIETKKLKLEVEGMTCANCALGIKKHLENKGLQDVNVNFSTGEASWENDKTQDKNDVAKTITSLGYKIKSSSKGEGMGDNKHMKYTHTQILPIKKKIIC